MHVQQRAKSRLTRGASPLMAASSRSQAWRGVVLRAESQEENRVQNPLDEEYEEFGRHQKIPVSMAAANSRPNSRGCHRTRG